MEVDEIEKEEIHKIYWSLHYNFKSHPDMITSREEELILIKLVALKYGLNEDFNLYLKNFSEDGAEKANFRKKIISLFEGKPGFNYFTDTRLFDFIAKLPPKTALTTMKTLERLEFKGLTTHIDCILDASLDFIKNLDIFQTKNDYNLESNALSDFWKNIIYINNNSKVLFPHLMNFKSVLKIMDKYKRQNIEFSILDTNHIKIEKFKLYCELFDLRNKNIECCDWLNDEEIISKYNGYFDTIINMPQINSKVIIKIPDTVNYPVSNGKAIHAQDLEIEKSISFLNINGSSFTLVPISTLFNNNRNTKNLREYLVKKSYVKRVINLPNGILNGTFLNPAIIEVSKNQSTKIQFSDATNCFEKVSRNQLKFYKNKSKEFTNSLTNFEELENRIIKINTKNIDTNSFDLNSKQFVNDSPAARQLRALQKNYTEYEQINIISENLCKKSNIHNGYNSPNYLNAVNLPKISNGNIFTVENMEYEDIKKGSYVLEFFEEKVFAEYISYFLETELGKLILKESTQDYVVPTLTKHSLKNINIPIPPLKLQKKIIEASNKIKELNTTFTSITSELGNNPTSVSTINDKLNGILDSLNMLSDTEKSLSIILKGETQFVEFKETLSLDVKKSKYVDNYKIIKEAHIEGSVIKTIAAFLNSKGGNLFVGVSDDSEIIGLENELKKFHNGSSDKFLLHLNNLINTKFSEIITHLLDIKLINCNEKLILQISVLQSPKEIFVENTKFYVRANPATEELKGTKMIAYIKQNFD